MVSTIIIAIMIVVNATNLTIDKKYCNLSDNMVKVNMKSVRKIPIQSFSVSGKFPSRKNNRLISYESQLELSFLYHLEFSKAVSHYIEQPCKVKSPSGKYYIPDFLVFFRDSYRKPLLVEIKYLEDVKQNFDRVTKKLRTLEKYALIEGYEFKLFTDKELLSNRTENYKFLYNYLSSPLSDKESYKEYTQNILRLFRKEQQLKVMDIAKTLGKGKTVETGFYLSLVWHLIAISVLWIDLNEKLTNHSLVYIEKPEGLREACLL